MGEIGDISFGDRMVRVPGFGRGEVIEELVSLGKMDPRTCREVGGITDERGHCLARLERDPRNPNVVRIIKMEYVPSVPLPPSVE